MQLARIADAMAGVSLILFVLERFHSPALAGATAFLAIFPGLLLAPLVGALLDRHGRLRLVVFGYLLAAFTYTLIGVLSFFHALPVWALLGVALAASPGRPFAETGLRSLFPLLVPRELWERAKAVDSNGYVVAAVIGPPAAGFIVGFLGGEAALVATGVLMVMGATVLLGTREPETEVASTGNLLRDAWDGLLYVVRNPTLRGLAATMSLFNGGFGVIDIALPVLVLQRLRLGPVEVGLMWAVLGLAGVVSVWLWGRYRSDGKEARMIAAGSIVSALGMALLPFAGNIWVVAAGMAIAGAANGPIDIGMFTLRQRRTDPAWMGRAFAISMALNFSGLPLGSALGGPLVGSSLSVALWVAVALMLAGATMPLFMVDVRSLSSRR